MSAEVRSARVISLARRIGGLVSLIGVAVLLGWVFDIRVLKNVRDGWPQMAPLTAFSFVLAGVALWSAAIARSTEANRNIGRIFAGIILLISLLKLLEYVTRQNFGLETMALLLTLRPAASATMAPGTAVAFLLLAGALLLASYSRPAAAFQAAVLLGGLVGWLGLSRYLFGGEPLLPYAQMGVHSALTILVLSVGIHCLRPDIGLMATLTSDGPGGLLARRLAPALLAPIVIGWLRLQGQRAGWYGTEAGLSMFVLSNILLFSSLIWFNGRLLNRADVLREHAAEALRRSHERTRAILETALDGIITMDEKGHIVEFNPAAERKFGRKRGDVIGRLLADVIIPPDLREAHRRGLAHYLATGEGPLLGRRIEVSGMRADGTELPLELSITRMPGPGEAMFTGFFRDITQRKDAEAKIHAQLSRLDLLSRITRIIGERLDLHSIYQVVMGNLEEHLAIDFGCVCLCDAKQESMSVMSVGAKSLPVALELGMEEGARIVIDQNGLSQCVGGKLVYEPDASGLQYPFPQGLAAAGLRSIVFAPLLVESKVFGVLIAARRKPDSFNSTDCEFLRQLTEHVALAAHQAELHFALQQAYEDLRQTQQTIMQQERLRALGQMASGISHDLANALTPIAGYTYLLKLEPNLSDNGRKFLDIMERAIKDMTQTMGRLDAFYRQREAKLKLERVQLNRMVEQVIDLTRARWSDMPQQRGILVQVRTDLSMDLPDVAGIESEIREALINLVFNAVDAMPEGGAVTLRTSSGQSAAERHYVHVEVCDTGVGMDEEARRRCLEPFFTTKGERGTGLGLAMVYGIATRHNAELAIESVVGEGTTVRLSFPMVSIAAEGAPTTVNLRPLPSRLKILIIDDDPLVINSLRDILESEGNFVTPASGGQEGIDAFQSANDRQDHFDIVITDLGMPHINGRKVAEAIKARRSAVPVIMLTGWGRRLLADEEATPYVDRVLAKPVDPFELRAVIAQLVHGVGPPVQ